MKKKFRGLAVILSAIIIVAGSFTACSNQSEDKSDDTNQSTEDNTGKELSGTLTMAGSTSMEKLANVVVESFMNKYPEVVVSAEFIGSSAGVEAVLAGTVDIGNASRNLKDSEKTAGAVENIVAIDGIAVILDSASTVTNLTKDQLVQIYTGAVNNWSAVGGADQPIVVVGRESGSGTRGAFEELLELEDLCKYSNEINSTGGVLAKVASTPGAVGYVSIDVLDDTIIAVSIDDVAPTEENIKGGSYLLSRPFVMATVGDISTQSELVQAFFEYMMSDDGQELVKSVGLVTID
jgi:phosphate transport system substrate-binding protein